MRSFNCPGRYLITVLWLLVLLGGCSSDPPRLQPLPPDAVVLAFGDSLTYGTGTQREQSYPARLAEHLGVTVINAGVPGEVSAVGYQRLPGLLEQHRPDLVILCHGGNDLLRRQSTVDLERNLRGMIEHSQAAGAQVVIVGVPQPSLARSVPSLYAELAAEYQLPYEGDILPDILGDNRLKSDTVHPNAAGYLRFAEALATLIQTAQASYSQSN